jgi:uncharacterized protein YbbK (DUF523 family)
MSKVLVSSCLLGEAVRFDASSKLVQHKFFDELADLGKIISICPELLGGLPTPRAAAEIKGTKVITNLEVDVSSEFYQGAQRTLALVQKYNVKLAILKSNSPSCSSQLIYDGSFSGRLIEGMGITASLLIENGIKVFNELELDEAQIFYQKNLRFL